MGPFSIPTPFSISNRMTDTVLPNDIQFKVLLFKYASILVMTIIDTSMSIILFMSDTLVDVELLYWISILI